MIDALGIPQSLLLLGGASDIALAIAQRYLTHRPLRIVLVGRPSRRLAEAVIDLEAAGATVQTVAFDAAQPADHPAVVEQIFAGGDIDVAVVAFGVLGEHPVAALDHREAVALAQVNYVGAVSVGVLLARRLRAQGHGPSSRCRRWPASGRGGSTLCTGPRRPAWTRSTPVLATGWRAAGSGSWSYAPGRCARG
ncbi:hypothetical protein Prum_091930 [Phytohabitans rumicis]|uniref:Decaprenylphospho-beta-D-erythro-pentofuranosid-2-ulose 2-reductase n=1 Tax=Phytohabitans rumicis TaxID=1076125 RepID=A0A6V8LKS8_9ACTN|nr:hypothetical protein Prum_091930 [Phytohabitans rumicis]